MNPCKTTGTTGTPVQTHAAAPAEAPAMAPGVQTSQELAAAGHAIIHPEVAEVCYAHGKRRGPSQLYQVMTMNGPQWECLPEARCKERGEVPPVRSMDQQTPAAGGSAGGSAGGRDSGAQLLQQLAMGGQMNQYGMQMGLNNEALLTLLGRGAGSFGMGGRPAGGGGGAGGAGHGGIQTCVEHNKKRSMTSLEIGPDGRFRCIATDRCKTKTLDPSSLGTCTLHGKYVALCCALHTPYITSLPHAHTHTQAAQAGLPHHWCQRRPGVLPGVPLPVEGSVRRPKRIQKTISAGGASARATRAPTAESF